jgi:hypothetical protein
LGNLSKQIIIYVCLLYTIMVNELYERLLLWKEFRLPNIIEREIKYLKQRILLQLWSQKIWYIYILFSK